MKRRWIACWIAAGLVLSCSLLRPKIAEQPSHPTVRPSATQTAALERGLDGVWRVFYSWGCGSFSEAGWILHADGTFYSPEADSGGTWSLKGTDFRLTFDYSPHTTYTGNVNGARDSMAGTMKTDGGNTGCWHAQKDPATPAPTASIPLPRLPTPRSTG